MGIIFDLDQTLLDTSSLEHFRRSRQWSKVYQNIPNLIPYKGIKQILKLIKDNDIPIAIVTNSPSSYCGKIITSNNWNINKTVCYHDVRNRKPHPEPILQALQKMGVKENGYNKVLSIGDRANDVIASNRAGVKSVAAFWGTEERQSLTNSNYNYECESVSDLKILAKEFFNI